MALTRKILRLVLKLHAMLGETNANVAEVARKKLLKLLTEQGFTWNDLTAVLRKAEEAERKGKASTSAPADAPPPPPATPPPPLVNVLDLVMRLIEQYLGVTPEQCLAIALWILYTHIFFRDLFNISPRLLLTSPVRGCGKTTMLILLEALTANAERSDNVTAASIYYDLDPWKPTPTLLLDEGDNLGLLTDRVLRAVLNSGHRKGGVFKRYSGKRVRKFEVFAPLALAAIYDDYGLLPRPLLQRCIWIVMHRPTPDEQKLLERLDENSPQFLAVRDAAQKELHAWAANCELNRDPEVPLRLRGADNWRPLLAIADDLGHGEAARKVAVTLNGTEPEEDPLVMLLAHIRDIFIARSLDRIFSATLVEALLEPEDSPWREWRGVRDDKPPHKLNQNELTRALQRLVPAHPVWALGPRGKRGTSHMGWYRSDFEQAWARYCPPPKTPTHQHAPAALPKPTKTRRKARVRKPKSRRRRKP